MKHMSKKIIAFSTALVLLTLAACTSNTDDTKSASLNSANSSYESSQSIISLEDVSERASLYYPEEVSFQYVGQDKIIDQANPDEFVNQECYLFDVIFEDKKISGVAVGVEDSSIWILDMNEDNIWLSESFMGLPQSASNEDSKSEPYLDISFDDNNEDVVSLYFANLDTVPEISNKNEGSAQWNEKEKTLTIRAVKATGSQTGTVDGPTVSAVITWENENPELVSVDFQPAPIFSHPSQVIFSGEIMSIEEDRLIEIAEYFRALIDEKAKELTSSQ